MHPEDDPYALADDRDFWADAVADRILERDPEEPIVVKGGISPSGVPHLGNMNEIVRGYFVAEALRDRGYEVRQVFTSDDRDPLRKLPRKLADLDGNIVDLGDVNAGALGKNLGAPYTAIPDPFGCCDSYGDHFSNLIEESAALLGIEVEMVSNTELYEDGDLEDVTRFLLENRERAREVLSEYQDKVDEDYVPFRPVCENCGHVTETDAVTGIDLDAGTVDYECTDVEAGDQTIEGCGHEGTATLRDGKLPWRFEWPAQWRVLGVDFEPFGKDHAEGSWPSGVDIARNVLGDEPPVPMVYEWFTLDGEAFSSSSGHVVLVQDVLRMLEPEVVRYFFSKDPKKARDFSIEQLDQLVDEFDNFERAYYQESRGGQWERELVNRAYPIISSPVKLSRKQGWKYQTFESTVNVGKHLAHTFRMRTNDGIVDFKSELSSPIVSDTEPASPELFDRWAQFSDLVSIKDLVKVNNHFTSREISLDREGVNEQRGALLDIFSERVRLPYTFAAVLGMTNDSTLQEAIARREGHIDRQSPKWVVESSLNRVELAREWARRTDNEFNYELKRTELPDFNFDEATKIALDELADFIESQNPDGETLQGEIYESAKRNEVEISDLFSAGYKLFFEMEQGPKLGNLLAKLDREFVLERLRRER